MSSGFLGGNTTCPSFPSALGCLIPFLLLSLPPSPTALRISPSAQTKDEPKEFSLFSILQLLSWSWEIRACPLTGTGNPEGNVLNPEGNVLNPWWRGQTLTMSPSLPAFPPHWVWQKPWNLGMTEVWDMLSYATHFGGIISETRSDYCYGLAVKHTANRWSKIGISKSWEMK